MFRYSYMYIVRYYSSLVTIELVDHTPPLTKVTMHSNTLVDSLTCQGSLINKIGIVSSQFGVVILHYYIAVATVDTSTVTIQTKVNA